MMVGGLCYVLLLFILGSLLVGTFMDTFTLLWAILGTIVDFLIFMDSESQI
jgi:hypothetical protein